MNRSIFPLVIALALVAGLAPAQNQGAFLATLLAPPSGYLQVPAAPGLVPASITFEAWVTYDETTLPAIGLWSFPCLGRKNLTASSEEWFLRVEGGNGQNRNLHWRVRLASGYADASYTFQPGQLSGLTHIAGTYDGTMARLFINGNQVGQGPGSGPITPASTPTPGVVHIGAGDTAPGSAYEVWNGLIDEVRLWSVARSQSEIQAGMFQKIYAAPNLEASWHLDGDGTDSSGNNNHGTVVAPTAFVAITLPLPEYQVNAPAASMTINAQVDPGPAAPISQTSPVNQTDTFTLSSTNLGLPYDLAVVLPGQTVSYSTFGVITPGNQVVNIDVTSPSLSFLFGSLSTPFPAPSFSFPVTAPFPLQAALQLVVIDPTNPDGFALSHAADYTVQ